MPQQQQQQQQQKVAGRPAGRTLAPAREQVPHSAAHPPLRHPCLWLPLPPRVDLAGTLQALMVVRQCSQWAAGSPGGHQMREQERAQCRHPRPLWARLLRPWGLVGTQTGLWAVQQSLLWAVGSLVGRTLAPAREQVPHSAAHPPLRHPCLWLPLPPRVDLAGTLQALMVVRQCSQWAAGSPGGHQMREQERAQCRHPRPLWARLLRPWGLVGTQTGLWAVQQSLLWAVGSLVEDLPLVTE